MNEVQTKPLAALLEKIIDYRGKTPKKLGGSWADSGYRALSALNVKTSGLDNLDSIKYIDNESLYKKWMKEEVRKGDILLTSEAPAGQVMYWDSDEKIVLSQRLFALRTNDELDSKFLKYYLQSDHGQKIIFNKMSGSTVSGISAKMFEYIDISYPSLPKQQKIGKILYDIDRKIELNNKINSKLEAMARELYDFWFVQYDFPDTNGSPYKSSNGQMVYSEVLKRNIPAGWQNDTIDRFGTVVGGSTPSTKDRENFTEKGVAWITPNDLANNTGNKFISHGGQDVTDKGIKSASLKIYPAGTILLSSRAPVGYMGIARNQVTTNQGFKSFIPNKGYSSEFTYYAIVNSLRAIIQYASGSTFHEISGATLKTVKVSVPPANLAEKFTRHVSPIFSRQDLLEQENQSLRVLRDWLLPMLMNGQITVK